MIVAAQAADGDFFDQVAGHGFFHADDGEFTAFLAEDDVVGRVGAGDAEGAAGEREGDSAEEQAGFEGIDNGTMALGVHHFAL